MLKKKNNTSKKRKFMTIVINVAANITIFIYFENYEDKSRS